MNPYLEQEDVWHDFHQSFIPAARELLTPQLRPRYYVKVEVHLYIHELPADQRRQVGRADVAVTRPAVSRGSRPAATSSTPSGVTSAPAYATVRMAVDVERDSYLEVIDAKTREVVTVIELLSPSNKAPGADRDQYLAKRLQVLNSTAHLVEIDLLRGGPRMPLDDLPESDYYAMVSRVEERPRAGIWPVRLRDRLPEIPVPLRQGDDDVRLDLQSILHRVYDAAGYDDYMYASEPRPRLPPEDAEWARQFIPR
jgi:hypothetical protein